MAAGAVGQGQWGRGPEAQGLGDGGVEEGQASGVTRLGGPGGTQLPPELCPQPLLQLGDTCVTRMSHTCHMQGTTSWGDTCVMWFGEVGPTPGDTQCQGGGGHKWDQGAVWGHGHGCDTRVAPWGGGGGWRWPRGRDTGITQDMGGDTGLLGDTHGDTCGDTDMAVTCVWHLGVVQGDNDGHGEGDTGNTVDTCGYMRPLGGICGDLRTRVGTRTGV